MKTCQREEFQPFVPACLVLPPQDWSGEFDFRELLGFVYMFESVE